MMISICLLAAGESKRFRGEKLIHFFKKKALSEHVLDLINSLNNHDSIQFQKLIVTKPQLMNFFLSKTGNQWLVIENTAFRSGMSSSLRMAVDQAEKNRSDFILLFLADMPAIQIHTVRSVLELMVKNPDRIIRPKYLSQPGFPVALPKSLFQEIAQLEGDCGAKPVIAQHKDQLILFPTNDYGSIFDIDGDN